MQCPSCEAGTLVPESLEPGLVGQTCQKCAGTLLLLGSHADWAKSNAAQPGETSPTPVFEATDSKRVLRCPKCQRIMLKFKVAADAAHSLDFCFGCESVWLDPGEWAYLKTQGLHTRIRSISTDPWQRRVREEAESRLRAENFKQAIGQEAFPVVERFRLWLAEHPHREEILRYLSASE